MTDTPNEPGLKAVPKVTVLKTITTLDVPSQRVLQGALDAEIANAVVIGYDKDGNFYFASSKPDGPNVLWLLELAKLRLLQVE